MPDEVIDRLRIEITGDSRSAVSSLDQLITRLNRLKAIGSGTGLSGIQKHLESIDAAASKLKGGSISRLAKLGEGLRALKRGTDGLKISSTIASRIVDIGAAVDLLKGVDMSQLHAMAAGLAALRRVGGTSIPVGVQQAAVPVPVTQAPDASALNGTLDRAAQTMTDATAGLGGAMAPLSDATNRTTQSFSDMSRAAENANNTINTGSTAAADSVRRVGTAATATCSKFISSLKKIGQMFGRRVIYRFFNAIISGVINAVKTGTNAVYQYSKKTDGTFAKSLACSGYYRAHPDN